MKAKPKEAPKRRCPYGCWFDPETDPYHIEGCREAAKP